MSDRNYGSLPTLKVLSVLVAFTAVLAVTLWITEPSDVEASTYSPSEEPQLFATTIDGSFDSNEANTIGVVTSSYFFVVKYASKDIFQMNNIRNNTNVVIKVGSGHMPFEEFRPNEFRHGHGVPTNDHMYQYMVQVEQAGTGVILKRCIMMAPMDVQSNGMIVTCG